MAKLPSLVTNATTGEAMNYTNSQSVEFKQTFEVTKNDNYTWTVKTKLYGRLKPGADPSYGTILGAGVWAYIGDTRFSNSQRIEISSHIYINNVMVQNSPYDYYQFLSAEHTFQCNKTGRYGTRLICGYVSPSLTDYYFSDYTLVYVTLPPFSGAYYKINNGWKSSMPWIKINGEWKRAKQFVKVNNQWKECKDSWIWNPEA